MNISANKNGTINLTLSKAQLGSIGNLCEDYVNIPTSKRRGVPVDRDAAEMLVEINDWFEYQRLDEKFNRRPAYERAVAAVKGVFRK
jgi:hypothetical protein